MITIEPDGSSDTGVCDCCGHNSCTVWGYVYVDDLPRASYFVHWTLGHVPDHGANIDLIIGKWGEGTTATDRSAVSLACRLVNGAPGMMVIDADTRPVSTSPLAGQLLRREDVVGSAFAQEVFAIADAVIDQDDRLTELRGEGTVAT